MSEHDEYQRRLDDQTAQKAAAKGAATNQKQISERTFNPSFLKRLQDPDVDSEQYDWVSEEFPALLSGAQIIGQRDEHFEAQQEFLNRAKAERVIAEQDTGSLLKRHEGVLATMEGTTREDVSARGLSSHEQRVIRSAMEVATSRQGLAVGASGLESVTTATSETRTVRHEEGTTMGWSAVLVAGCSADV
jgi:hypothetical protein